MAAAIKMDELMVNWLGSDSMYENVMNLIEENKLAAQKKQQQQQQEQQQLLLQDIANNNNTTEDADGEKPPTDGTATATASETTTEASSKDNNNTAKDNTNKTEDSNSNASPRCVIPKFYLGDPSRPRRRRRLLPMPQSDTWDPLPENEQETTTAHTASNHLMNDDTSHIHSLGSSSGDHHHHDMIPSELATVPSTQSHHSPPMLCVREQVQAVFAEIGFAAELGGEEEAGDTTGFAHKQIPVQEFVRVTKDIFRFPTFFNGPLCRRLLHLWQLHNKTDTTMAAAAAAMAMADADETNSLNTTSSTTNLEGPAPETPITYEMVEWYWLQEMEPYDAQERFFRLCKQPAAEYIVRDDFLPFIKALLNDHPGLEFLSNHAEFQEKYAVTVITRIFYCVNKCHSGRITCREIRRSDLLDAFLQVDEEEDINKVTRYFSYEHFYVLYCRFWELDHDRDYRITREDLLKYGDHSLSHMIVDRIFDAAPRPFEQPSAVVPGQPNNDEEEGGAPQSAAAINREYLSYEDFIYFMLSEEDKANDGSVRYWFTCVDVDGDGRLNNMEMRSFYAVQLHRMQCMGHEIVPFEDMLCQMMDMIKPASTDCIIVEDFLQTECAPVAGALFDALFNLNKYLLFEQRDPFVERQKREDEFETDWDRFSCIDYNRLAMEEEAREEEAMEIDWVTVDDEEDDGLMGSNAAAAGDHSMQMQVQQPDDYMAGGGGGGYGSGSISEAPF